MHVGIANPRWREKRSRHSQRMRNPQFYVSDKRPIEKFNPSITFCEGNPSVTNGFPSKRPVIRIAFPCHDTTLRLRCMASIYLVPADISFGLVVKHLQCCFHLPLNDQDPKIDYINLRFEWLYQIDPHDFKTARLKALMLICVRYNIDNVRRWQLKYGNAV